MAGIRIPNGPPILCFMLKLELIKYNGLNIVYIEGIPAFSLLPDGEKDWIAPDGVTMYLNNKEFVDEWLKNEK